MNEDDIVEPTVFETADTDRPSPPYDPNGEEAAEIPDPDGFDFEEWGAR